MRGKTGLSALALLSCLLAGCAPAADPLPGAPPEVPSPIPTSEPSATVPAPSPVPPTAAPTRPRATAAPAAKKLLELADLGTGRGPVYSQDWAPDGRWLVTADYDLVRVWDMSASADGILEGHTGFVWGLAWSPTPPVEGGPGRLLASASQDGTVRLWDVAALTGTAILRTGWALCVDWAPDGRWLAVGTESGLVQVWDAATWQLVHSWASPTRLAVISVAWSPDGSSVAAGEWGGEIYLWDAAAGQVRTTIAGYTAERCDVNGLAWSPDGSTLASAHQDGRVRLWAGGTGALVREIAAHTGWARGLAWSPDGRLLASTGQNKRVYLWDPQTGDKYAYEQHNFLPVWSVSWSPDGTRVATGAGDYDVPHVGATIVWRVP